MKRCAVWLMLVCLLVTLTGCGAQPIAVFEFDNSQAVAELNLADAGFGDKTNGYNASEGDGVVFASVDGTNLRKLEWTKDDYNGEGMQPAMTGGTKNPWGEGAHLEFRVPTVGVGRVFFSAQVGATNKGPRDYQLQYSTDGRQFAAVGDVVSLTANKQLQSLFASVELPADAAGCEMLYIRIVVASDALVGGGNGLYGSTSGETAINHVRITAR